MTLIKRWTALFNLNQDSDAAVEAAGLDLIARYEEPHRRYHTVRHLTEVLDVVDELADEADDLDAVRLAAWFHDAVYESGASHATDDTSHASNASNESNESSECSDSKENLSNEEASARLAELVLPGLGVPAPRVAEVARLVRLTERHSAEEGDRNAAVLFDADLAILAADPARYDEYAKSVREEYREIRDDLFRPGRAQILEALLSNPSLYRTAAAHARFESPARANVAAEIARLASP